MKSYYCAILTAMAALLLAGCAEKTESIFPEAAASAAPAVATPVIEATPAAEIAEQPETTEEPEATEAPKATEKPKATEEPKATEKPKATEEPALQSVTSGMSSGGYESITVKAGIPVRWNLKVPDGALTGCNSAIVIPEYGIEKTLQTGDNIIEFTPGEEGTVQFSCWMGMIRAEIKIV